MDKSCIITKKKSFLYIVEDKCNHKDNSNMLEEKIIERNKEIIKISYTCLKCNIQFIRKWKKIGRFYLTSELS